MPLNTEYRLHFCSIQHREDDICIIEINEGVNLDAQMSNELIDLTDKVMGDKPFALLSNRINSYSLTFEAMSALANMPNLVALAIVVYSDKSQLLIETQNFFLTTIKERPVKIFNQVNEAIDWLEKEMSKIPV